MQALEDWPKLTNWQTHEDGRAKTETETTTEAETGNT